MRLEDRRSSFMTTGLGWVKRHPVLTYFVLVFALGWYRLIGSFLLVDYSGAGTFIWAAGIAGLLMAVATGGWAGLRGLLGRCLRWRVGLKWWLLALLMPAAMYLASIAAHVIMGGEAPRFTFFRQDLLMAPLVFVLMFRPGDGPSGEIGWRGFALPAMLDRWGPLPASLVLGALYGVWHLPEFLEPGSLQNLMGLDYLPWFTLGAMGNAVMMTWLYNRTGGSALISGFLFHGSLNFWGLTLLTDFSLSADGMPPIDTDLVRVVGVVMTVVGIGFVVATRGRLGRLPGGKSATGSLPGGAVPPPPEPPG
jgi:membrane protease YdiL (CAAX protease family)